MISADEPLNRINLNLPSVNAPTMSGEVTAVRRLKNVSGHRIRLDVTTKAPAGSTIEVSPNQLNLARNESRDIEITISDNGLEKNKQYFGQITMKPRDNGHPDVVLPVAFFTKQGDVTLSHTCAATTILRGSSTACEVSAQNLNAGAADANIELTGAQPNRLEVRNVTPPATATPDGFTWSGTLSPAIAPRITGITPGGSPAGFLPLAVFGITPISGVGDETIVNFDVPSFKYGSETYTSLGLTSNGYAVVGGGSAEDVEFDSEPFPSPAKPNNALAPFWTDLDPGSGGATRVGALTDGTNTWLVLEWENVPTFGTTQTQSFQIWIQTGASESITYAFGKVTGTGSPEGLVTGAENRDGTSGVNLGRVPFAVEPNDPARPDEDFTITTSPPTPGGSVQIGYDAFGLRAGTYQLAARMTSNLTVGTTKEVVNLTVNNP